MGATEEKERNEAIVAARRNGDATLRELAQKYKVSPERIRQISLRGGVSNTEAAKAYMRRKHERMDAQAEANQPEIMMQFIGGKSVSEIASDMGLLKSSVQGVIDENTTDKIVAARSNNLTSARHPDATAGPREDLEPRDDRFWTTDRIASALTALARKNGNRLPSSTQYKEIAPGRDDLPSFATIRNRLGRWTAVRLMINDALKG